MIYISQMFGSADNSLKDETRLPLLLLDGSLVTLHTFAYIYTHTYIYIYIYPPSIKPSFQLLLDQLII